MHATPQRPARPATRPAGLGPALLLVLLLGAAPAAADVIHLRTGDSVKGRPLREQSNEEVLVVEDFLTGALRTLAWEVVDPADRQRIWVEWDWANKAHRVVSGRRLVQRLLDGSTEDLLGVVEKEEDGIVFLRAGGQLLQVRRDTILEETAEDVSPREVWSPEQLYDRFRAQLESERAEAGGDPSTLDSREHWRLAEYAEWAEHWEKAREHYAACAADPEYLNAAVAQSKLERVEAILRAQTALREMKDIKRAISLRSFRSARADIASFTQRHENLPDVVLEQLARLEKLFTERRNEYFQLEAKIQFPKIVERAIKKKLGEKDVTLSDVTGWTRRDLPEQAFKELEERFARKDDVTPDEVRQFWENRRKGSWRTAGYGAGTFIVEKPQIQAPKRTGGGGGSGGQPGPAFTPPKPPTRDQWWAHAAPRDRESWVLAFFVENSGLFEVGEPKWVNCPTCGGVGLLSTLTGGGEVAYLCTRCGGARRDKTVRFR